MSKDTMNLSDQVLKGLNKVKDYLAIEETIISVIKEDHKPLKELIKIMKDGDKAPEERKLAFADFAPLLVTHAKAEEKSLYEYMKTKTDLREHAFEGDAEHSVADQLCEEIVRTTDPDQILAKIKVLAEAVEHHIKEEENEILPDVEKKVDADTLKGLIEIYADAQAEMISVGQDDSPSEADLKPSELKH